MERASCRVRTATTMLLFVALPAGLFAEERVVTIASDPPGASVYQLKGFKRELLGETPLTHRFELPGRNTLVRLAVDRRGYAPQTLELDPQSRDVFARLEAVPLVASAPGHAGSRRASLALAARRALDDVRETLLSAIEPWDLSGPAVVDTLDDGYGLLRLDLQRSRGRLRSGDAEAVADRLAGVLARSARPAGLDGVLLSFGQSAFGGVRTSVGTRLETEMVCEGGMSAASVWDHCATRAATTSTTSYGTQTEYRCVGGTVTRQVYNPCLRRVQRQKTVVDVANDTTPASLRDVNRQWIAWDASGARYVGGCDDRDPATDSAGADHRRLAAVCDAGAGAPLANEQRN